MSSDEHAPTRPGGIRALGGRLLGDERVRFVLVGGFNTGFGYLLFVVMELLVGRNFEYGYFISLYVSFVIATIVAFWLHRHFTYRVTGTGSVFIDFVRFMSVYLVSLGINTVALWALVDLLKVPVLIAQALIVIVTTLVSYFGHKFFSFRRTAEAPEDDGI